MIDNLGSITEALVMLPKTFVANTTIFQGDAILRMAVPANPARVYLGFFIPYDGSLLVFNSLEGSMNEFFFQLNGGSNPFEFWLEKHKILQTLEWWIQPIGGSNSYYVIEVIYIGGK